MPTLEATSAPPLPWHARLAHLILSAMMAGTLAVLAVASAADRFSWYVHALVILIAAALAGHLRRVAWGRAMGSLFSIWLTITLVAALLPDPDDHGQALLGDAPVWLSWLIVVGAALAALLPATIVGLRREWFSDAKW